MNRTLVAIDPGLSGGIAWRGPDQDGNMINSYKMPDTIQDLYTALENIKLGMIDPIVMMEKVGKHRLGNSAQSSATFAKHVGHLEMALVALKLPVVEITATGWMKDVVPGRPKGVEYAQVRDRKNYIKDQMQRRYPDQKVTLATADALGVLTYFTKHREEY